MIVHRDYRDSSGSVIKIFDNRIEFFNPGKLYGGITITDLLSGNYTSKSRNKLIAKAFKEIGLVERYGSGIRRVQNICKDYGLIDPLFEEVANGFQVVLFNTKSDKQVNEGVNEGVNELFKLIESNSGKRIPYYASVLRVSEKTIERWFRQLRQAQKIEFRGAPKTGGYFIVEK